MFYSTNVLQKKGPLGAVWIAAHHDVQKKLSKVVVLNTDIAATAGAPKIPSFPFSPPPNQLVTENSAGTSPCWQQSSRGFESPPKAPCQPTWA